MNISDIDFSKFKSAMFDYDGTLTENGVWTVDPKIAQRIGSLLSAGFPMAVCTGRQLDSFDKRFMPTLESIRLDFGEDVLKNFYFMGENGAIGYEYVSCKNDEAGNTGANNENINNKNVSSNGFWDGIADNSPAGSGSSHWRIFYEAKWPEEVPKDKFLSGLRRLIEDRVDFLPHLIPIVVGPTGRYDMQLADVNSASAEIHTIVVKYMSEFDAVGGGTASDYLHVGDSGLGVLICPADGDKDSAVPVFRDFLRSRGVEFSGGSPSIGGDCREIMVVGDSHGKNGNDYYFLNGKYGTSFGVGNEGLDERDPSVEWPILVTDDEGNRLFNGTGTLYLLDKLCAAIL